MLLLSSSSWPCYSFCGLVSALGDVEEGASSLSTALVGWHLPINTARTNTTCIPTSLHHRSIALLRWGINTQARLSTATRATMVVIMKVSRPPRTRIILHSSEAESPPTRPLQVLLQANKMVVSRCCNGERLSKEAGQIDIKFCSIHNSPTSSYISPWGGFFSRETA